ncbi:MAG: SDR family oxidoreductase [Verrucomicrobia bacterium]|nr:SDR family oxidoreductase [Verrucomicrobiota bacterium]
MPLCLRGVRSRGHHAVKIAGRGGSLSVGGGSLEPADRPLFGDPHAGRPLPQGGDVFYWRLIVSLSASQLAGGAGEKSELYWQLIEHSRIASFRVPIRSGEKSEIAKLAVFLCSEDAGYIIGQTIVADGGTTSLMSLISDFRAKSTATFGKGYVPGL